MFLFVIFYIFLFLFVIFYIFLFLFVIFYIFLFLFVIFYIFLFCRLICFPLSKYLILLFRNYSGIRILNTTASFTLVRHNQDLPVSVRVLVRVLVRDITTTIYTVTDLSYVVCLLYISCPI